MLAPIPQNYPSGCHEEQSEYDDGDHRYLIFFWSIENQASAAFRARLVRSLQAALGLPTAITAP
tara:strand:+ start:223 stop:414 length:192 start_codon:yes stop_codon:yes gene_type:complete